VLESTVICIDNSEWTRNGDYEPNRVQAQRRAAITAFYYKTGSNPENTVGLLTMAGKRGAPNVLCTLTSNESKMAHCMDQIEPHGEVNLLTGIQVAQLALKHRANMNLRQRILVFVSSPVPHDKETIERAGAKLKKESVSIDIVYMGDNARDEELLMALYNKANNADNSSHFLRVPPGGNVMHAVSSSPILVESDGRSGFAAEASMGSAQAAAALRSGELGTADELDFDPAADPEFAMAVLRSRQDELERQQRVAAAESGAAAAAPSDGDAAPHAAPTASGEAAATAAAAAAAEGDTAMDEDDDLMQQAMAMSQGYDPEFYSGNAGMDEDEALARAIELSQRESGQQAQGGGGGEPDPTDPEYMASVLANLPGVNPDDPALKDALDNLKKGGGEGA